MNQKIIIIGGVAGGATTAARLRRLDEQSEIIMLERGNEISYANCGLPYYIGNIIQDRNKLLVQTPESFGTRFNIDVRVKNEVLSINPNEKKVTIANHASGKQYEETYDKLVLSPGAEPLKPPIPGINQKGIFTLRNVADTDNIKSFIEDHSPQRAIVVGAGFIGLEMAESLNHKGIFVTIVEMAEQVMTPLDYEMAAEVHQHLKTKNVEFYLNDGVSSFENDEKKLQVTLNSGRTLDADMVILSIGVRPETRLAKEAGLETGDAGGIKVNSYLQTSDPDIYAVGDAIEFPNPISGKSYTTYLAGPANKQGRLVAGNIVQGNQKEYTGSISTAIAKVFDITVASCGLSEKTLKKEGIPYYASITHGSSHAGYYPNAFPLTIKIQFDPEKGTLFGAQIVGYEGVDKRIDMISTVIKKNGSIYDLQEIEHAYAPPYSSAKDPANIAGFAAENILKKDVKIVHWYELQSMQENDIYLLDVRTREEFDLATIDGSVNIPVDELRNRIHEVPKNKKIIVFCGVGLRAYVACRILMQHDITEAYNLTGGYKTYQHATQKQSNEDIFERDTIGKDDHIYQYDPESSAPFIETKTIDVDASGMQCPGPIMKLKQEMDKIGYGEKIKETATDPGFYKDVQSWAAMTGNKVISVDQNQGKVTAVIEKQKPKDKPATGVQGNNQTMVVFSDDFDRALASFVIANGAASAGKKVTMFFTFWGLSVIKKKDKPRVKKDFMGRMFGMMLPSGSHKLKLSSLNMWNMGRWMMKKRMKSKRVDSLETMIQQAVDNGVELIACQMSMDIMGIKKEELLDNVNIGGVATYLQVADTANVNLFI